MLCKSLYEKSFSLSFTYDAPRIWNDLPDDVRSAKSLSLFRKKLKDISLQSLSTPFFRVLPLSFSVVPTPAEMLTDF